MNMRRNCNNFGDNSRLIVAWFFIKPETISINLFFFWFSHIIFYPQTIYQSHSIDTSFIPRLDQLKTLFRQLYLGFDFQIGNQKRLIKDNIAYCLFINSFEIFYQDIKDIHGIVVIVFGLEVDTNKFVIYISANKVICACQATSSALS